MDIIISLSFIVCSDLNFHVLSVGYDKWWTEATGVTDCFYNCSKLPSGSTIRFRVACVNKAGQGPYSNVSEGVSINVEGTGHTVQLYLISLKTDYCSVGKISFYYKTFYYFN